MPTKFISRDGKLYLKYEDLPEREVIRAWESYSGWYWFGVEVDRTQDSIVGGEVIEDDSIWFGFVQGFEEEWGYFSQAELESMQAMVWEIPKENLPRSGRR